MRQLSCFLPLRATAPEVSLPRQLPRSFHCGVTYCGVCMQAAGVFEEAQREGVDLDVWSYAALIKGHCQAEQLPQALKVLGAMEQQGIVPNVVGHPWAPQIRQRL